MDSQLVTVFVLSLLLVTADAQSQFKCGRNDVESFFASLTVSLNCQPKLAQFNNCCLAHDTCYDNQLGRSKCDNAFCTCLSMAAADNIFCKTQSDMFCNLVRQQGGQSYGEAGRRRGKRSVFNKSRKSLV